MLLYENKKAKILTILRMGINPFKRFVATGEVKEEVGLLRSRKKVFESIFNTIENNENFILPIIGDIGVGKTHLFWALRKKLHYHNTFYISLETVYRRFYYNLYSEVIDEISVEPLRYIASKLCNEWGALEKKYGFFHVIDIDKIRKTAKEKWQNEYKDRSISMMDVINAITTHQLDPYKKREAERWLLGELMDVRELSRMDIMYDLRNKDNAFMMLKILIENSKLGSILFIDDFEKIITLMKSNEINAEDEIYDPSYYYGTETDSPELMAAQKILNKILKLQDIKGFKLIITLNSLDSLEEIKKKVKELDNKLLKTFKEPLFFLDFEEYDIYQLYRKNMKHFLKSINFLEYLDDFEYSYFPLNERILKEIFHKTQGNPRRIIKFLIKIFNEIIYSDEKLEDIIKMYDIRY